MKSVIQISDYRGRCEEKECSYTVIALQKVGNSFTEYLARCLSAQEVFSTPAALAERVCWELLIINWGAPDVNAAESECLHQAGVMFDWFSSIEELIEMIRYAVEHGCEKVPSAEDILASSDVDKYIWLATYSREDGADELIEYQA